MNIQVAHAKTHEVLKSFPLDQGDRAYEWACEMESLGIPVVVQFPGLAQTLAQALGQDDPRALGEDIDREINSHAPQKTRPTGP